MILCPAKTKEILLPITVDKNRLPGKNSAKHSANGYLHTAPESRSGTGCVQILEKAELSEENLCEKEREEWISCDIEEVKFYARPSLPVSASVCLSVPSHIKI